MRSSPSASPWRPGRPNNPQHATRLVGAVRAKLEELRLQAHLGVMDGEDLVGDIQATLRAWPADRRRGIASAGDGRLHRAGAAADPQRHVRDGPGQGAAASACAPACTARWWRSASGPGSTCRTTRPRSPGCTPSSRRTSAGSWPPSALAAATVPVERVRARRPVAAPPRRQLRHRALDLDAVHDPRRGRRAGRGAAGAQAGRDPPLRRARPGARREGAAPPAPVRAAAEADGRRVPPHPRRSPTCSPTPASRSPSSTCSTRRARRRQWAPSPWAPPSLPDDPAPAPTAFSERPGSGASAAAPGYLPTSSTLPRAGGGDGRTTVHDRGVRGVADPPRRRRLRRGPGGLQRDDRPPAGADRPLRERRRRRRRGEPGPRAATCRCRSTAAATASPARRWSTPGSASTCAA